MSEPRPKRHYRKRQAVGKAASQHTYQANLREEGARKITVWLSPEAAAALDRGAAARGDKTAAVNFALVESYTAK